MSAPVQPVTRPEQTGEPAAMPLSRAVLWRWAGWFSLGNGLLLLFVSWRYVRMIELPGEAPAWLFLALMLVGHFAALAAAVGLVVVLATLARPRRRLATALGVALGSLLLLGLVVDSVVFTLYRFHLNGMVWSLIVNGGITEILPLSGNTLVTTMGIVIVVLLAEAGAAVWAWKRVKTETRWGKYLAVGVAAVMVAGQLFHIWADAAHYTPVTRLVRFLPAGQPLTAKRLMRKLGWKDRGGKEPALKFKTQGTALKYPLEPLTCAPPAKPLNVVFIVIDGWRFDMLNEAATPHLWQFSRHSLRFDRHSCAANSTRFGIFSLFYGLYGTYWHAMLAEQKGPVLISELNQAGYQFGAFGSARFTSPEFDRTVFAEVRDRIPLQTPATSTPERDREITRRMLGFLDRRDRGKPFFGFLFYDSTHAYDYPADAPAPFQSASPAVDHLKLNKDFDPVPVRNRFLNAVHFVDSLAAQVLQRLEKEGLLTNTVVVVTGDHGQEFNDTGRNYWGHNSNFSRYQTQVPFILYWPGKAPAVYAHLTSHLDVAPTLLVEILNCSTAPEKFSNGRTLLDPSPRLPLLLATWDRFALSSPGRIDVMFNAGSAERFDEDYRDISTPIPPQLITTAMEGMSRFYAR